MQVVNFVNDLTGWSGSSERSEYREKIGLLTAGLCLAGTTLAKEILTRTGDALIEQYVTNVHNFETNNCTFLDNNHTRMTCHGNFPQAPSGNNNAAENALTTLSITFQIGIMVILGVGVIRTYKASAAPSGDASSVQEVPSREGEHHGESSPLIIRDEEGIV